MIDVYLEHLKYSEKIRHIDVSNMVECNVVSDNNNSGLFVDPNIQEQYYSSIYFLNEY